MVDFSKELRNEQDKMFDSHYKEIEEYIKNYFYKVFRYLDYETEKKNLVWVLMDLYQDTFENEILYILELLGIVLSPMEQSEITNSINLSDFIRSNQYRINGILTTHEEAIHKALDEGVDRDTLEEQYKSVIERLATSELHMAIEKASVESGKVLQGVTDTKIVKIWHCVGDDKSCPICLELDGTIVGVDESFSSAKISSEAKEFLSYTGGDITYAHPRCRCWVTYEKA